MSENGSCENGAETGIDIANDIRKLYAKTYWSEDSLTADGEIPKVKAISTSELADRIEAAARRAEDTVGKLKEALQAAKRFVDDVGKAALDDSIDTTVICQCAAHLSGRIEGALEG